MKYIIVSFVILFSALEIFALQKPACHTLSTKEVFELAQLQQDFNGLSCQLDTAQERLKIEERHAENLEVFVGYLQKDRTVLLEITENQAATIFYLQQLLSKQSEIASVVTTQPETITFEEHGIAPSNCCSHVTIDCCSVHGDYHEGCNKNCNNCMWPLAALLSNLGKVGTFFEHALNGISLHAKEEKDASRVVKAGPCSESGPCKE